MVPGLRRIESKPYVIRTLPAFTVLCTHKGCKYAAHAAREGQAIRSVAAHILHAHAGKPVKE